MKYKNKNEISAVIESFEHGTISRENWGHAEHLTVALHYLSDDNFDTAYKKMREGIFNLLRAFEVDLSKEVPYHETLTVFWLETVRDFKKSKNGGLSLEFHNELIENFDKNYPLKFYSRELLFSDAARRAFVNPDLPANRE